jgi:hypothetical protein
MYPALQNAETINRLVEQGELPATRRFRIVKPQNNIPVLGVCEYCNAEFTADPQTVGRPQDAHSITPSLHRPRTVRRAQMQGAGRQPIRVRSVRICPCPPVPSTLCRAHVLDDWFIGQRPILQVGQFGEVSSFEQTAVDDSSENLRKSDECNVLLHKTHDACTR